MATANAVWGIEIGQCALKAMKLRPAEPGKVELVAFDLIEHPKILSQPDADADELIRAALEKFVSRNDWQRDAFVLGVPGQQTFARFCKLPPVESKKIPEIVRFEASQQIPFEMDDVVWDYQVFQAQDAPEVEVGIFAIRKDLIRKQLDFLAEVGIAPRAIQTIPCALYNFWRFESGGDLGEDTATVVIDVGAQHTDLIVVERNSAWSRNIPLGGNSFTEALVKAFKLSFAKAETLKRTAATSKYARQIFQAMRPVFADLVAEIQRSLGFYAATHRGVELKQVLVCGNAFHLPGLQKYLENNLTIAGGVSRLERFNALVTSATANAPQFAENILSFAPAYGLALQGLGLATVSSNLLPPELARVQLWKRKWPYFAASAACLVLAAVFPWLRAGMDRAALAAGSDELRQVKQVVEQAKKLQNDFKAASTDTSAKREKIEKLFELHKHRALVPRILDVVHAALPEVYPPELASITDPKKLKELVQSNPSRFKRTERRLMIIDKLEMQYVTDVDNYEAGASGSRAAQPGRGAGPMIPGTPGRRMLGPGMGYQPGGEGWAESGDESGGKAEAKGEPGFWISLEGRLLYGEQPSQAVTLITEDFYPRLRQRASQPGLGFYIPEKDTRNKEPAEANANLRRPWVEPFVAAGARGARPTAAPQPGQPEGEATVAYPDPVTGEDMATDWTFRLGFKIKLGEPPEQETTAKKGRE